MNATQKGQFCNDNYDFFIFSRNKQSRAIRKYFRICRFFSYFCRPVCRNMLSFISISLHFLSLPQSFPPARARSDYAAKRQKRLSINSRGETSTGATKLSARTM